MKTESCYAKVKKLHSVYFGLLTYVNINGLVSLMDILSMCYFIQLKLLQHLFLQVYTNEAEIQQTISLSRGELSKEFYVRNFSFIDHLMNLHSLFKYVSWGPERTFQIRLLLGFLHSKNECDFHKLEHDKHL